MNPINEALTSADTSHFTRDLMFTKPVVEMPYTAQIVAVAIFALGALATLWYAYSVSKRTGSSYPLWVYLGSLVALPFETFDLTLGHCLYPQIGQLTAFELLGVKIPWFLVLVYPIYIAGAMIWVYEKLLTGTMTRSTWWKAAAIGIASAAAFEPPALYIGLWLYFGDNTPFRVFGLPFWWAFANPVAIITMGLVCYHIWNTLLKRKCAAVVVIMLPCSLFAIHTGLSTPVYLAINTSPSLVLANLGALGTAALSLFVIWLGSHAISTNGKQAS